jgi:hypothetical protein
MVRQVVASGSGEDDVDISVAGREERIGTPWVADVRGVAQDRPEGVVGRKTVPVALQPVCQAVSSPHAFAKLPDPRSHRGQS